MERLHIALHMPNIHELLESGSQRLLNAGCDADRAGEICICSHTLPPGCPGVSLQDSFVIAADRDLNISTAALLHHFRDEADRLQESQKTGVLAVLQIARAFVATGKQPERNVIFAFWDGEEKGLLGSKYFVQTCPFISRIKGYLNFDMIGRNNKPQQPEHVVYFYTAAHPVFGDWLKEDIKKYGLRLSPDYRAWDNPVGGSDNSSFAKAGIPIIWYHTDGHPDYHQPSDHADRLNWDKIVEITKASFLNMWKMANEREF